MAAGALVGQRLGSYVVRSFIGQGGMGEVYQADDTRLGRTVAIKVLPPALRDDSERKERLEREAKSLAAISHPHICHLFDVGHQDGTVFLVMEYLDGETLAARLARGRMSLDRVLAYGVEIAGALAAAHRQGVIHRDLKPSNIMLTGSGAKLVDFGLAARPRQDLSLPGGADVTLTLPGIVLGTPTYMSPEQVESKEADERSDIFAFGAVLYEMVTGTRAFEGDSAAAVMAAVLEREPVGVSIREPLVSPALDRLIRTCLEKTPDARWQDASDLARELRWVSDAAALLDPVRDSRTSKSAISRRALLWSIPATCLTLGAGGVGWYVGRSSRPPVIKGVELSVAPADAFGTRDNGTRPTRTALAISPDGEVIVFSARLSNVAAGSPKPRLYKREIAGDSTFSIPYTEEARGPFFSPDGAWIGFFTPERIMKVLVTGGPPSRLFEFGRRSQGLFGASWGDDHNIYFSHPLPDRKIGVAKIPDSGGTQPKGVTWRDVDKNQRHVLPHVLPGAKALLFTRIASIDWNRAEVVLHRLDTPEERVLISGGASDARYVPSGHLVYMKMGTLMGVSFDLDNLEVGTDHVALIDGVMQSVDTPNSGGETGAGQFAFSASGILLYVKGGVHPRFDTELLWVDRQGKETQVFPPWMRNEYWFPRLSPMDRNTIAVAVPGAVTRSKNIGSLNIERTVREDLIADNLENAAAVWSPDGTRLAYSSSDVSSPKLYVRDLARGRSVRLTDSQYVQFPSSWIVDPSGVEWLAFLEYRDDRWQIWLGSITGLRLDNLRQVLACPTVDYICPDLSPDGRLIAYASNELGEYGVYVRLVHEDGRPTKVSHGGGTGPVWLPGGDEIVYRHVPAPGVMKFSSVRVTSRNSLEVGKTSFMFEKELAHFDETTPVRNHDIAPDGRLLLVRKKPFDEIVTHITIDQDWFGTLRANVPRR